MNFVARNLNKLQNLSLKVESSSIYMKLGSLFVLFYNYEIPPNQGISNCIFGVFGKLLTRKGALTWFHDVWTCNVIFL
jgi:hypothetical protein